MGGEQVSEDVAYELSRVATSLESEEAQSVAISLQEISTACEQSEVHLGGINEAIAPDGTTLAEEISRVGMALRDAICRPGLPCDGVDGGKIGDLTEAAIDIGRGLALIASAIGDLAEAVRGAKP